jgi:hypothetical protein
MVRNATGPREAVAALHVLQPAAADGPGSQRFRSVSASVVGRLGPPTPGQEVEDMKIVVRKVEPVKSTQWPDS